MKKCKKGYYYCYTDEVCKPIPKGLRVTARFSGGGKEPEETGIDVPTNGNGDGNGNGNGGDGGGVSESKSGDSSLRDWFGKSKSSDGKPGWVQLGGKYAGKPCAKQPGQTTKPKCGSSKMAADLDDKEEEKAFNRKQRQDQNPDRKGKAINVKTEETVVEKAGEKDACYKKVKSRYSVWPSAYASGALVKCRKKGAANWGNKSESVEYSDWRDDFRATEYEFIDIIKPEPLVSEGAMPDPIDPTAHRTAQRTKKIRDRTKTGDEGSTIAKKKLKGPSLPMEEVETVDEGQKCWKGYVKKGTKKMFGKTYNNCVKKEEFVDEAKDDTDIGEKTGKKVPRKNISDANRYEMEKRRRKNLEKRPGDAPGDSKLIQALRSKAKETGNYVEEKEESRVGGGNLKKLAVKATKRVDADVDGDVDTDDMKSSKTGEFVPSPDGKKKLKPKVRFEGASDWRNELGEGAAWTKKSGKNKKGGLNEKGRKSYERENPGSDLKAPSKKKGNKRRASFCARMKGMKKKLTSAKTARDPDSRINKSLRSWNC
tara:strand:+ start:3521 stop:5137 length:1617 start_codon:yes stop_codon:yes gene_type:complete